MKPSARANPPPSFPTRRSRRLRDGVFALSALAWAGAMYGVWRASRASALTGEARELAVFTEAFEQNLRMRLVAKLKLLGAEISGSGEAVRRTKEPYEGRLIVREKWRVTGDMMGRRMIFERDSETRWDREAGGFRAQKERLRVRVPGMIDEVVRVTATRARDLIVTRVELPGGESRGPVVSRVPRGIDPSTSSMDAADVRPLYVGARWKTVVLSPFTGDIQPAEVVVVEEGRVPLPGPVKWGFKAVTRVEKGTGRYIDQVTTWYDSDGRALVQTGMLGPLEITLERVERLPASDAEWEKMAPPE